MTRPYIIVESKGLLQLSSSTTASYEDGEVELLRLQPLPLQHVSAEHVQSLLQLSEEQMRVTHTGR